MRENALGGAASAYLRAGRFQLVDWMEWGEAAFVRAKAEDKPVLLDIGAVWGHWCKVMGHESYEDPETARIIQDLFVAVKVDRDERPDVDARYQAAVAAISGQAGWPLTAFLTPDGEPYFGGGYFPPDDRYGRAGFRRVLLTMAEAFQKQRGDVEESAEGVKVTLEENEGLTLRGVADESLVRRLVEATVQQFDSKNGGFGAEPKFPNASAIRMMIDAAGGWGEPAANVARVTLWSMARGGIHDQLGGGFHRYSVDEAWRVPRFEKLAHVNAELLEVYVAAYEAFRDEEFVGVARGIVRWMDEVLSDRERGGFYASQVADAVEGDDGGYFTWTRAEMREVLTAEEFGVAAAYFDVREVGDMRGNPQKNVLKATKEPVAGRWKSVEVAAELLNAARGKMYMARLKRPMPYVDRTVYSAWNGMCVSAYLAAGRVLEMPEVTAFAVKTLDRVLDEAWDAQVGLARVVSYGQGMSVERLAGVLEDYAFVAVAALDAFEVSGKKRYIEAAIVIAEAMVDRFWDEAAGGFWDAEASRVGLTDVKRKAVQDEPTPAGNAVAAGVLMRLAKMTGDTSYGVRGRETLETFAGLVGHYGLHAATYGLVLSRAVRA